MNNQTPDNLDKVINDSKAEIHIANEEVQKKKRGRKPKDQAAQPAQAFVSSSPEVQKMSVDGYKAMLAGILNLAGLYLNKASDTKCFTLEKEELELITQQGAECMIEFVPSVQTKYMKLAGFGIVCVSIYGMKYSSFVEITEAKKREKAIKVNAEIQSN